MSTKEFTQFLACSVGGVILGSFLGGIYQAMRCPVKVEDAKEKTK